MLACQQLVSPCPHARTALVSQLWCPILHLRKSRHHSPSHVGSTASLLEGVAGRVAAADASRRVQTSSRWHLGSLVEVVLAGTGSGVRLKGLLWRMCGCGCGCD